jgi:CheY-like chemotaxis protein
MNAQQLARILLVDDNPADIELAMMAFQDDAFPAEVTPVDNGKDALDRLRAATADQLPDLILLDLNMPGVSGFEVLEFIRTQPRLKNTPVVVFTTSNAPADRTRCERAGATRYLVKPRRYVDLVASLSGLRTLLP